MNKNESILKPKEEDLENKNKTEKLEATGEKLNDVINSEENKLEDSISKTKKEGIEILANSYQKVLENKLKELREEVSLAEKKQDEEVVLQKEQELKKLEGLLSLVETKKITETNIVDLEDSVKNFREGIKTYEKSKDEEKVLETKDKLRQAETSLREKNIELAETNEKIKPLDNILKKEEVISVKKVELEVNKSELRTDEAKKEAHKLVEGELISLKNNLELLKEKAKEAEKKQDEKIVLEIKNEIRQTEESVKKLNDQLASNTLRDSLNIQINQIKEAIKDAEARKDESKVLSHEKEVHDLEEKLKNVDKKELTKSEAGISEKIDNVEINQAENEDKAETGSISQEALNIFSQFNLSEKDLEEIPNFNNLSEAAQVLLAQNFSSNSLERAQARSATEKSSRATSKNKWINKLQSIKVGIFNSASIDKASSKEEKEIGIEGSKEELTNLTSLYQEVNLEGEMKEGQVEVSFVNIADYDLESLSPEDKKNTEESFTAVNKAANELGKMPKHWQDEYATKENRAQYKEALNNYKEKKAELAAALLPLDSITRISETLNELEKKVNMIQFLTADPELKKEWKDMGKNGVVKFFTNLTNRENAAYMGAGMATRAIAASFIAYAAIPATAAVFGAIRGYKRGEKAVRKKDEEKAKSMHIKDTGLFAQKEKVFNEITEFNKENREPGSERSDMENIIDKCVKDPAFIAKAKELEGISENSKEKFIPSRDADYVEEVYQSLDNPKNKLSEKEFSLLLHYSGKVSKLKELNSQINEQQDKSVDKKTEKASDVSEKLDKLISKINSGKLDNVIKDEETGQTELEKHLDMLSRRLNFSQDKAERDLINFGDIKERANNQATLYEVLAKGRLVLIENKHNTEVDVYKETEEQVQRFLSYIEDKQGSKLTKERKKFFIKKAIEGAGMGALFAVVGSSLTQGVHSIYEGVSNLGGPEAGLSDAGSEAVGGNADISADSAEVEASADVARNLQEDIADNKMAELMEMQQNELGRNINIDRPLVPDEIEAINSLNLPDSLEINSTVLEIISNDSIPFKEAILNNPNLLEAYDTIKDFTDTILASVVEAGKLTQEHLNISKLTEEYNLNPAEQNSLLEMLKSSKEELMEKIGDLRAISHTIENGENFTQSLREVLDGASEHTKDAFIERVNEGYGILDQGEIISEVNREELLVEAVNRLSVEGANPDSGVANLVYEGNILKVNSETGQWDISQGESDFTPKAEDIKAPEAEFAPRDGAPIEKIPSRPTTEISTEKSFSEGASVEDEPNQLEGAPVNSFRASDLSLEDDGAEVFSANSAEGAPVTPVEEPIAPIEEVRPQEEVPSSQEPVSQEGAPVETIQDASLETMHKNAQELEVYKQLLEEDKLDSIRSYQELSSEDYNKIYKTADDYLKQGRFNNLDPKKSEIVQYFQYIEKAEELQKILNTNLFEGPEVESIITIREKSAELARYMFELSDQLNDSNQQFFITTDSTDFAQEISKITGVDNLSDSQKEVLAQIFNEFKNLKNNGEVNLVYKGTDATFNPYNHGRSLINYVEDIIKNHNETSGENTIKDFIANLSEEQRKNLSEDQLKDLYEDYSNNLSGEEEGQLEQDFSETVDELANKEYDVAQSLNKATNFGKQIYSMKSLDFSNPETSFKLYGENTSFSNELNKIVGEDNFYESLSSEQKSAYEEVIKKIQELPDNSMGNRKSSFIMRSFVRNLVE